MTAAENPGTPGTFSVPAEIAMALSGSRFALCGFDSATEQRISKQIALLGGLGFPCDEQLLAQCSSVCEGVLIGLDRVSEQGIRAAASSSAAVLLVGSSAAILGSAGSAYCWPAECMATPWSDAELVIRLFRLVEQRNNATAPSLGQRESPLVLVADDDRDVLALVEVTLRNIGVDCRLVEDGLSALRLARQIRPNLLALDLRMPRMDGFQVLKAIRSDPRTHSLPVILLTACDDEPEVARAIELNANEYLRKPVSPGLLLSRLKRLLNQGSKPGGESSLKPPDAARKGTQNPGLRGAVSS